MGNIVRKFVMAASAAALLSSQAAFAAPQYVQPSVDPLVSLSVLGTAQSRAAVCAAGAAAATAAATQGGPGTCVLPVRGQVPPPAVGQAVPPPPPVGIGTWAILPGLIGLLALLAFALDDDDEGTFISTSP